MAQTEQKKDSKQVVVELTMTLEEARSVIWPWDNLPVPMGKLLESRQIGIRDLAWAANYAGDSQVREAARTQLAHWLKLPITFEIPQIADPELRFGPKVIEGSHYLEDSERDNMVEFSAYAGFAIGAGVMLAASLVQTLITYVIPQFAAGNFIGIVCLAIFVVLGIGWIVWFLYNRMRRLLNQFRTFRQGREGEHQIIERLRIALDNRWTIFHNLILPDRKDDNDIVLVGPGGVWTVEVKSSRGTVRAQGKKWEVLTKKGWVGVRDDPYSQVTGKALQLNDFLKRQGIVRYVQRAIALAEPQPISNFTSSEIPVWLLPTIDQQTGNLKTDKPPTQKEITDIVSALEGIVSKQIAREEAKYAK